MWFKVNNKVMFRRIGNKLVWMALATLAALAVASLAQAQSADKSSILAQINQARLSAGLAPLAVNPALEKAAQRHSDDMAAKGFVDHTGSDGSSAVDRITAAGYPAWPSTRVWAENVYAGNQGFAEALDFFLKDDAQRRNLLNPRYREIGVGAATATNASGEDTSYWALVFGSQPNVLPIFVNDGVTLINVPQVAIHLTQEEAVPGGEGNAMGSAIEVRVSADSTFKDADWQKWESLMPFTFDTAPGLKTVYMQLRDGGGRTAISAASVQYDPNSTPQVVPLGPGAEISPAQALDQTPGALATATPFTTVAPVQTVKPSARGTPMPTPTSIILVITPQGTAVFNPTPTVLPTPQARPLVDRPDAVLPDWLLPVYVFGQTVVIILGVLGFFRIKLPADRSAGQPAEDEDPPDA
jgi:uncharacterized protein YkwD